MDRHCNQDDEQVSQSQLSAAEGEALILDKKKDPCNAEKHLKHDVDASDGRTDCYSVLRPEPGRIPRHYKFFRFSKEIICTEGSTTT